MSTYPFDLPEQFRVLAKKELGEDEELRQQSFPLLRQLIVKNPSIRKCRTDERFMLKFLRFCKFSVLEASKAIERYLVARERLSEWFENSDPCDPDMEEILDRSPIVVLGRDDEGRTVLLMRLGRLNKEKVTQNLLMGLIVMVLEVLADEEEVQIGGMRVWLDFKQMSKSFNHLFNLTEMKSMMNLLTEVMPVRIREIHAVKPSKFTIAMGNMALPFPNAKLKGLMCHKTQLEAKNHMPEALWPEEYGGSIDCEELNQQLRRKLEKRRDSLMRMEDKLEIDVKQYTARANMHMARKESEIDSGMQGTFRKLTLE